MTINSLVFFSLLFLYTIVEIIYFKIANKFDIVDKPNGRSSHISVTIRGGGIIFPLAGLIVLPFTDTSHSGVFALSLSLVSVLSFVDDIKKLSSKFRLFVQSIAAIGLLYSFSGQLSWFWMPMLLVTIIGIINAYNFMDGINGITALYSFTTIGSLYWVSEKINFLQPGIFFESILAALLVFSFFNLRKKARCFAGDVGSVSMAFIICFLLYTLTAQSEFLYWIFFLAVYGIDAIFTIVCRVSRREQLMKAHRSHFYQYLANEAKWGHLWVSLLYALVQMIINIMVICAYLYNQPFFFILPLFVIFIIYTIFRLRFEGRHRLFTAY